jgi:hypothetical protein
LSSKPEDDALLELGLLMIVTGLTIAIIVGVSAGFIIELYDSDLRLAAAVLSIAAVTSLGVLGFFLVRRLLAFLR